MLRALACAALLSLGACAELRFRDGRDPRGVTFFDPVPAFQVTLDKDCKVSASVIAIPGRERSVRPQAGWGSSALTASFQNGLLTSFGQTSDTQADELGTFAARALGAGSFTTPSGHSPCPGVILYPITDGRVDFTRPNFVDLTRPPAAQ